MFAAGIPEKVIQKNTGHRSVEALRVYEHVSKDQEEATCKVLTSLDQNTSQFESTSEKCVVQKDTSFPQASSLFQECNIGSVNIEFGSQK